MSCRRMPVGFAFPARLGAEEPIWSQDEHLDDINLTFMDCHKLSCDKQALRNLLSISNTGSFPAWGREVGYGVLLQPRHSLHMGKSRSPRNFPSEWQGLNPGACRLLIVLLLWGIIQIPKKTLINLLCMWRKCQRIHDSFRSCCIHKWLPWGVQCAWRTPRKTWWRPGAVLVFLLFFIISRKCLFQREKALIIRLVRELSL